MLQLDKKTVCEYEEKGVKRLKVFFVDAGCSGTKIDMIADDFSLCEDVVVLESSYPFDIYVPQDQKDRLEQASITRVVIADHSGRKKTRYIFSSDQVQERCGCGSSFAFEKKSVSVNLENLQALKNNFKHKKL